MDGIGGERIEGLMRIEECGRIIDRVKGKLQRLMENIREKSGLGLTRSKERIDRGVEELKWTLFRTMENMKGIIGVSWVNTRI